MEKLLSGLREFMTTVHTQQRELFERLAGGQSPAVLFVACSDSRVDPSLITQSEPGELFVVRNAGNIVPPHGAVEGGAAATVEYAVAGLGVCDIVVCGHSDCGAMKALLDPGRCSEMPAVAGWLRHAEPTRRIIETQHGGADWEDRLRRAIEINVLAQITNLRTLPSVAARIAEGSVRLHGWVWDIASGETRAFDAHTEGFVRLTEEGPTI